MILMKPTRILALTALTLTLLGAGISNASNYYGNVPPLGGGGSFGPNALVGPKITVTSAGTLEAFGMEVVTTATGQANFGLYAADGGGGEPGTLVAQTGAFNVTAPGLMEVLPTTTVVLAPGDYWIMAGNTPTLYFEAVVGTASDFGRQRALPFTGSLPASYGPATVVNGFKFGFYIKVTSSIHSDIYVSGDLVPGAGALSGIPTGSVWKNFGPPSINASGTVAFKGTWTGSAGSGTGIFVGGVLVAKVGSVVLGLTGTIATLKDPVIDDLGHVAFPGTVTGPGISSLNDAVVMGNALGVIPFVKAQEGSQAPDAPVGALWSSFTSVSVPSGGQGVLILGFMKQGFGGITSANDRGVWSTDSAGAFHLVLQENTTVIGTRTVKSFTLLTTLSGTPGQTHAFNNNRELVSLVIYTDNFRAIVHTNLP